MTPHEILLDPNTFFLLWEGLKNVFAIYDHEQKFQPEDRVIIKEYDPIRKKLGAQEIRAQIWHTFRNGRGAPSGYVVIQIIEPILYSPQEGDA